MVNEPAILFLVGENYWCDFSDDNLAVFNKVSNSILLDSGLPLLGISPKCKWVNEQECHFNFLGKNKTLETTQASISRGQDKCIVPHHSLEFSAVMR